MRVFLVSGVPGAGKTTVARALASRFPRSAHIEGDRVGEEFIVNGFVPPQGPPRDEARAQLQLRRRNMCALADSFTDQVDRRADCRGDPGSIRRRGSGCVASVCSRPAKVPIRWSSAAVAPSPSLSSASAVALAHHHRRKMAFLESCSSLLSWLQSLRPVLAWLNVYPPSGVGDGGEGACPVPPQSWTSPGGPRSHLFLHNSGAGDHRVAHPAGRL